MNIRRCLPLIILLAVPAACTHLQVGYDVAANADLRAYKTYGWLTEQPKDPILSVLFKDLQASVDRELSARGFSKTPDAPDLLVITHNTTTSEINVSAHGYNYSNADYWGSWGGYWGPQILDIHRYGEGTLVVDLVDAKTKQMVWRGWASDTFSLDREFKKRVEQTDRAVREVFKEFPPPLHEK